MPHTITTIQIVGVSNTIDLSVLIPPLDGCLSLYGAVSVDNVQITSIVGSIATYVVLGAGSFEFSAFNGCYGEGVTAVQVQGSATVFQAIVSQASNVYNFTPCCNECFNPIIVSDLHEGDSYIPFSLEMEDGTIVSTLSGDTGEVLNGKGVIELALPLVSGASIQLQVNSDNCKAVSSIVTVKSIQDDCDSCVSSNLGHIRVLSVSVKHEGINLVSIANLSIEAFGELRYRLDNGDWFSDWSSIGSFNSLVNHTLGIKLANNPSKRIEYPFLAISYT